MSTSESNGPEFVAITDDDKLTIVPAYVPNTDARRSEWISAERYLDLEECR